MTQPGIEPRSPGPIANTLFIYIYIYIYMVFDASVLSTQHYKVRIKGKVEQSREWSNALPNISV